MSRESRTTIRSPDLLIFCVNFPDMRLEINRVEGLRNDLLLRLERREIEAAWLSISDRDRLMKLPGIPRHRDTTPDEHQGLSACRIPIDAHLRKLGVLDESGTLRKRAVAISNRNLGTNHGNVAWQRGETPPLFHIREDPVDYPSHTCLTAWRSGGVSIEDLLFDLGPRRASSTPVMAATSATRSSGRRSVSVCSTADASPESKTSPSSSTTSVTSSPSTITGCRATKSAT